ncbi:hypothetical protein [Bradyrhizobium sp. JYMT SZCCT0428]|uniref:hypothetical protein n=1 Tax=Bradyrhizobium sp. JYMT SZCCT0428 TaxID=2807673 RepID=UPI001BA5600B|nr:hypothetical protein [Bradyrhizobium sp. JYMT SZCCT0428]MBR1153345.1 hypothetical protein [Bradyrhizobium sp. JYMT SZCCT0428]
MTGLAEYMRGMVDAGPTRSGHRTPTVIVEAPVNGIDAAHVRYNAWQFRQILGRGVHGILLCQAETADAVRAFVESCRYPHNTDGVDPEIPSPLARMAGAIRAKDGGTDAAGRKLLGIGTRGRGSETTAAPVWGLSTEEYMARCDPWPLNPKGELLLGVKPRGRRQLRGDPWRARTGICRDRPGRPQSFARLSRNSSRTPFRGKCRRRATAFWRPAAPTASRSCKAVRPTTSRYGLTRACA